MQKFKSVDEFLVSLDEKKRAQVDALRSIIMNADPGLVEHIKWNAPSYVFGDEDRITFNVMNKEGVVSLVLHMGATRKETEGGQPIMHDASGLVIWNSDIRGVLSFKDLNDIDAKQSEVIQIIQQWLRTR